MPVIDITGQRFGLLTVIGRCDSPPPSCKAWWACECDCGKTTKLDGTRLRTKHTTSCGCHKATMLAAGNCRRIHGAAVGSKTKEYRIWRNMINRCRYDSVSCFKNYGARGIKVCERWARSFVSFLTDMGKCPRGLTLERNENDGDYSPENCRWATPREQAKNRRNVRMLTFRGHQICTTDAATAMGVGYNWLYRQTRKWKLSLDEVVDRMHNDGPIVMRWSEADQKWGWSCAKTDEGRRIEKAVLMASVP